MREKQGQFCIGDHFRRGQENRRSGDNETPNDQERNTINTIESVALSFRAV